MRINLRNMSFSSSPVSKLDKAALIPEVSHALLAWAKAQAGSKKGVLIGGLALSFYVKPRETTDVDVLFLSKNDIPETRPGFKRTRAGAFQENKTHVEVEVVHPAAIHLPSAIAAMVFDTAVEHDGMLVASVEGLIALKLFGADTLKREFKDLADVVALLENYPNANMYSWNLPEKLEARLEDARRRATS